MTVAGAGGARLLAATTVAVALVCLWSYVDAADRLTWWMEALPVLIVYPLLWSVRQRFPLTALLTLLIALHSVILLVGAHYTYAEVPLFHWIRDAFDLSRNHYDRVGHLAQGFVPAIAIRERLMSGVATAVRILTLTFDVEHVVLGGGLTGMGDALTDGARAVIGEWEAASPFLASLRMGERISIAPADQPIAAIGAALLEADHG